MKPLRPALAFSAALFACALSLVEATDAQQPSAAPRAPTSVPGLPPGHPPIDPKMDPGRREQLEKMLEERNRRRALPGAGKPGGDGIPDPRQPSKPMAPIEKKTPVDEHGHCLGQGADDRPKDINLFHGWLGTKEELGEPGEAWSKAVRPPSVKNSADWWKWRLIPYPYRYDNHDDHCDPQNEPVPLIANILNLAALIYLGVRFGRRPLREALIERKKRIMAEFDKAAEIKQSAEDRLQKYEDELEHLEDKLVALREQYLVEGKREQERVHGEMEEVRARMLGDAEFRISQEGKAARDDLSREALEAALAAAEQLVRASITPADHTRLANEYLDQIGPALAAHFMAHPSRRGEPGGGTP